MISPWLYNELSVTGNRVSFSVIDEVGSVWIIWPSPMKVFWVSRVSQFCSSVPEVAFQGQAEGMVMSVRSRVPPRMSMLFSVSTANVTRLMLVKGRMEWGMSMCDRFEDEMLTLYPMPPVS